MCAQERNYNPKCKRWVFTINNFTEEDDEMVENLEDVKCLIAEHELGSQGTPHIQGYVEFKERKYRTQVSRMLPRAYLAIARGSIKDNWKYCSKEKQVFVEKGYELKNNNRGDEDFLEMYEDMKQLCPNEFEEKYPKYWVQHREQVMKVMIDHALENAAPWDGDLQCKNIWVWGKPGIGKSKWANGQVSAGEMFKKNVNKWWDGFNLLCHKFVIIEDYPPRPQGQMLCQHLKIWSDRYPFIGECKGSHMGIEPGRFFLIITSNYSIEECFDNPEDVEAIKRRFYEVEMTRENALMIRSMNLDTDILKQ